MSVRSSALVPSALSFFLVTLNASMATTALPAIGRELGSGPSLPWVLTGYSLVFAVCLLPAGAWADRIGPHRAFTLGTVVFAATSALCALAQNLPVMLAARGLQGAAAALLLPAGLSLLNTEITPGPSGRARAIGRWTAAGAIALVVGSPLGGAITSTIGWQGTFWLNLPLSLLTLATTTHTTSPSPSRLRRAGVGELLRSGSVLVSSVTGFALNFASYGAIFAVTFLLQDNLGRSAWVTGLVFVPMTLLIIPANLLAGRLTSRLGVRRTLLLGQSLMILGLLGLIITSAAGSSAIYQLTAWLLPIGAGAGLVAPAVTTLMLDGIPPDRGGLGSGVLNAARQLGSGAAPAIFGVLLSAGQFSTGFRISLLLAVLVIAAPATLRTRELVTCA
ncbi:MFS transporter [Kribbella solani]|uniref:DHA2 family methylenomycin A resistance protein-like MFS transporter n=1 Tax=Kribbella solani TaxID=236067 RepID=A0A841DKG0_9ACTN|nr:MFS transporter [Kribbella solani]MBB5979012.1 DHA2 family methylenomycin A resistance protein-like MFS transporter [Kribbella solani]